MDMRRFFRICGVEKESVRTFPKYSGHRMNCRSDLALSSSQDHHTLPLAVRIPVKPSS
jgi:hypothetical protein